MAKQLEVKVKPKTALLRAVPQSLFARLKYTREVPSEDPDDAAPKMVNLLGSRREELDVDGEVTIRVDDYADATLVTLQIEYAQGSILFGSDDLTPSAATPADLKVVIPDPVYTAATQRVAPASDSAVLIRAGRFVTLDDAMLDMSGYRLYVAPIRPNQIPGHGTNPQTEVVRGLLGLPGAGEVTTFEAISLDPAKLVAKSVNALGLQSARVHSDGAFDVSVDITADEIAWLWLLLGPRNFAGYQLDPDPTQPRGNVVIVLPMPAASSPGGPAAVASTSGSSTPGGSGSHEGHRPPLDFDERQLVDHPDQFSDDPGSTCRPFENPHRVLGERRFFTVLRVDQPEIGGQGSLTVSRPISLDLVPPIRLSAVLADPNRDDSISTGVRPTAATRASAMRASLASTVQPRLDLRATLDRSVFKPSMDFWRKWVRDRSRERGPVSGNNPIEWEGDPSIYQAASAAGGHVLEWRVRWRSNGYSLGNVAHTLTLAPRQTKRISKISWRRREQAARREVTEVQDALTQVTTRARDYTDAVQSSLSEWAQGQSQSRTTGVAGGLGFALGPVVIGGGAAHGSASSSSSQSGGRRVAASEHQQLRDAIRQYGEATRRLESTVITEVTQEEEVEGVAETLRNVNYCHALTVMYYEILRHLRVDTEFAGLRECLFVPLSITPFDVDKALKWREQLKQGMLDRSLRWALDYLDEVDSAWVSSNIPAGPRMNQPVNYVTGSIYVQLSIERPREISAEEQLEDYYAIWAPLAPLLGMPVKRIVERLKSIERDKDAFYQKEVAPTMAARWADRLELRINGRAVDFTLASTYRFGSTVRIDFAAPVSGITRNQLRYLTLVATQPLAVGSVANVKSMTLHYYTDHYDRRVESVSTTDDLIDPATGKPNSGASLHIPITPWEAQDQRREIEDAVERLITHLNSNLVYYHKVIWWLMDRDELYMLLDGFTAPYGRRFEKGVWIEETGRSIASVVERDPMAILGNTLVMRVAAGAFLGIDGHGSPEAAHRYYYDSQVRTEPLRVSLPTEGLYAQALMDQCEACEEHHGGTDWVLSDSEPELEWLADQLGTRRQAPADLTPTQMPQSIINLQNAPAAPDPTGLAGILQAVTTGTAFRDMAGLAGTQANAMGALTQAASLAQSFGQMAVDFQKAKQGTADAKQKVSNIKKAQSEGLIDDAEAKRQTAKALDDQNMTPKPASVTTAEEVEKISNTANANGTDVLLKRPDGETLEIKKHSEPAFSGDTSLSATLNWADWKKHEGLEGRLKQEVTLKGSYFKVHLTNNTVDMVDAGPVHGSNEFQPSSEYKSATIVPLKPAETQVIFAGTLNFPKENAEESLKALLPHLKYDLHFGKKIGLTKSELKYKFPIAKNKRVPCTEGQNFGTHADIEQFAVDLGVQRGTEVRAAMGGTVVDVVRGYPDMTVGTRGNKKESNFVLIKHADNSYAIYGHLRKNKIMVKVGDSVSTGTVLGQSGNSGFTDGDHLHFSVNGATWDDFESIQFQFFDDSNTPYLPEMDKIYEASQGLVTGKLTRSHGDPNGQVSGDIGDICVRDDGSPGTLFYVKESGAAGSNTGWVAKATFP